LGAAAPPAPQPAQYGAPPAQYGAAPQPVAAQGGLSENAASALCYVVGFITGILFLVIAPYNQNRAVRFHAFQSIFLNVAWIAVWIVETMISVILWRISFALYSMLGILFTLVGLGFFILWIFLIVKAYQGQKLVLPIIGQLAEKQA
jgi:uncharacterized membrane protein